MFSLFVKALAINKKSKGSLLTFHYPLFSSLSLFKNLIIFKHTINIPKYYSCLLK